MIFDKPINRTGRNLPEQVQALYDDVGTLVEQLNTERATRATGAAYTGSAASGTAAVGDDILGGRVYIAVIGGVPTLAVRYENKYENKIAARGGDNTTTVSLSATLAAGSMTFSASGTLDALFVIL